MAYLFFQLQFKKLNICLSLVSQALDKYKNTLQILSRIPH